MFDTFIRTLSTFTLKFMVHYCNLLAQSIFIEIVWNLNNNCFTDYKFVIISHIRPKRPCCLHTARKKKKLIFLKSWAEYYIISFRIIHFHFVILCGIIADRHSKCLLCNGGFNVRRKPPTCRKSLTN